MYRPTKPVHRCQCCQQGVSFTDFKSSSNLLGNHNSPQIIHSSDNPCCGARHLPASTVLLGICRPRPLAQVASPATGSAPIAPQLLSYIFLLLRYYGTTNFRCHCEERSDVAISSEQLVLEIATPVCALVRNDSGSRQLPYNNFTNYAASLQTKVNYTAQKKNSSASNRGVFLFKILQCRSHGYRWRF